MQLITIETRTISLFTLPTYLRECLFKDRTNTDSSESYYCQTLSIGIIEVEHGILSLSSDITSKHITNKQVVPNDKIKPGKVYN